MEHALLNFSSSQNPTELLVKRLFKKIVGNFLVAQWLGRHAFTAKGAHSISGWGTKIPQATRYSQK